MEPQLNAPLSQRSNPPIPRPPAAPALAPTPPGAVRRKFGFAPIADATAQRIGIYGSGGIGKTSLAARAPGPVAVFDLDDSLRVLKPSLEGLAVQSVEGIATWHDIRDALHQDIWASIKTIIIDSASRAEQLAIAHTLATVKNEKNTTVNSIEAYGYGKGYRHVADTWLCLLGDLDQHVRAGRNIVMVLHECTASVPNPTGDDYIRWEPRLQAQNNGNLRAITKEWLDHLLCVRFDVTIQNGVAVTNGTRTIYPVEMACHMAKSRSLREPFVYQENSDELWQKLFQKGA